MQKKEQDFTRDRPVQIADGVYWVGSNNSDTRLHCNPYLIVDGDEGILIDGGSRPDFATVMMKVMQAGLKPQSISTLIYQSSNPDVCGSIAHFEEIIHRPDLRIISHAANNRLIRHYGAAASPECIDELGLHLQLKSGRVLQFIRTPYASTAGTFMTYDAVSSILFSSVMLGQPPTQGLQARLFLEIADSCRQSCAGTAGAATPCSATGDSCPVRGILQHHQAQVSSLKALRHACDRTRAVAASIVAPQHGRILHRREDIGFLVDRLAALDVAGIDALVTGDA